MSLFNTEMLSQYFSFYIFFIYVIFLLYLKNCQRHNEVRVTFCGLLHYLMDTYNGVLQYSQVSILEREKNGFLQQIFQSIIFGQ